MNPMRTLIIDDEPEACMLLAECLRSYDRELEVAGTAHTVADGIAAIRRLQPDLLFLDVRLSPGSGFDILNAFGEADFGVIFVTAYEEYAINAIRFSALDYLLKPIDPDQLAVAVERALQRNLNQNRKARIDVFRENIANDQHSYSRLVIPTIGGFEVIRTGDIRYCKADRNYTDFFLRDGQKLTSAKTLKMYEEILSAHGFFRAHTSYLINLAFVKSFRRQKKGGNIVLDDGAELPLSEARKKEFMLHFLK